MKSEFKCQGCGACCRIKDGIVRVGEEEIRRIAAFLGMSEQAFIDSETEIAPDRKGLVLRSRADESCVYLTEDNRCRIHPVKPDKCRTFPFEWRNADSNEVCPALRAPVGSGTWLKRVVWAVVAAIAAVVVTLTAYRVYKTCKLQEYRVNLTQRGFPEGYVERLIYLQYDHPAWIFEPLPVADMDWNAIVDRECAPSWNLVVYADWAPDKWNDLKQANYAPYYAENAKAYDSGAWYQASRAAIAYFMDPRNWLNERDVFMFETLGFDADSQTRDAVERTLSKTFMARATYDGGSRTFAELLMDVGCRLRVSPVFLAGRLASEQGEGTVQAFGTIGDALTSYYTNATGRVGNAVVWGKRFTRGNANTTKVMAAGKEKYNGYYNFFNFRAYGLGLFEIKYNAWVEATSEETRTKYRGPWNTQERAIEGGAMKIKERYIDTHRHTRYLQKFSVLPEAGAFRWKQYMQNIAAPLVEARNTSKAYGAANTLDAPYRFLIPVYRGMPLAAAPDPANGKSVYSPSR